MECMVRIAIGAPAHPVSDRLYGVFFEDLNHGADGGLNANMVSNYSFDGVYVEHNRLRPLGEQRWRTKADPLRFWHTEGLDVESMGNSIRGGRGQDVPTSARSGMLPRAVRIGGIRDGAADSHGSRTSDEAGLGADEAAPIPAARCDVGPDSDPGVVTGIPIGSSPDPSAPVHPNSRFARFAVRPGMGAATATGRGAGFPTVAEDGDRAISGRAEDMRSSIPQRSPSSTIIENLGYNGGGKHADEPAMAIKPDHSYLFEAYVRSVAFSGSLAITVVDAEGHPLTDTAYVTVAEGGDPGDVGTANTGTATDASDSATASRHKAPSAPRWQATDDAMLTANDPLCRNGWFKMRRTLRALPDGKGSAVHGGITHAGGTHDEESAHYGKLRIAVSGDCVFDLDCVSLMDADYWGAGNPKWRFGRLRRDLVEAIAALRPRFVRFPGGCIVEGITPGNEYNWKDTIGALPARKQQYSMWGFKMPDESSYSQSYQIGFYEYFCLCEDLKAKPLPTLFAGINCQSPGRDPRHVPIDSDYFRKTVIGNYLDLIEFANGDPATSRWARVRADMGHPTPFGLDMIGVGNENYGADYMAKFDAISSAIHAKYPDMLCVMSAGLFPFKAPMSRAWEHARDIAGSVETVPAATTGESGASASSGAMPGAPSTDDPALGNTATATHDASHGSTTAQNAHGKSVSPSESTHEVPRAAVPEPTSSIPTSSPSPALVPERGLLAAVGSATGDAVLVDEHSYHSPAWFISQAHRFDEYPRDGAGVYFGEYSANGYFAAQPQDLAHANQWRSALGEAAFLTGCERNGDVVRMTSYAPLLALVDGRQWNHNLIEFNPETVSPTVNAQVEQLFSAHVGTMAYQVAVSRSPRDKDASLVDARDGLAGRIAGRVAGVLGSGAGRAARGLAQAAGRAGSGVIAGLTNLGGVAGGATVAEGVTDAARGVAGSVRDAVGMLTVSASAVANMSALHRAKHVDRDDRGELELIHRDLFVSVTGSDNAARGRRFIKIVNIGNKVIDTRIDFADTFAGTNTDRAPVRVRIHMLSGDARAKNQLDWHGEPTQGVNEMIRAFTLRPGAARGFALALRPRSVTLVELSM